MAIMLGFGFVSGLPLFLSGFTLTQWLTESRISVEHIGLVAYLGLPYTLKFLWGPVLDQVAPPGALARLGRRRGWLLVAQPPLVLAVVAMALSDPASHPGITVAAAFCIAVLSATQDIAIDAWRIESFSPDRQGFANAVYVWGYRLAMFVSGSVVLFAVGYVGWHTALLAVAVLTVGAVALTLIAPEPPARKRAAGAGLWSLMTASLADFMRQRGAVAALGFVALFNLGEAMAGTLLTPFYAYLGFNRAAVATAIGPFSLFATMAGIGVGGWLVSRLGLTRAMISTGFVQMGAMAMYVLLAVSPGVLAILYGTVVVEAFAQGLATAAFLAYLSGLCSPAFAATQFALLTSLAPLASRTIGGFSGYLQVAVGWPAFYAIAMLASLPAMALMLFILLRRSAAAPHVGAGDGVVPHRP